MPHYHVYSVARLLQVEAKDMAAALDIAAETDEKEWCPPDCKRICLEFTKGGLTQIEKTKEETDVA